MKTPFKIIAIISAVVVLTAFVAWLAGAFQEKVPPGEASIPATAPTGTKYTVTATTETVTETATGTINARDETSVSARILAVIREIPVRAGDTVKQGDILVQLDDREFRARVEQANQALAAAAAALEETRTQHQRIKALYEKQVASRSEFDRSNASLKSRQADYQRNRQLVEEASTALSFTIIHSPIDGKVIERFADPGDTATPGMALIKIYNPNLLRLDAQVRESLTAGIHLGDTLNAYIDALQKQLPVIVDEIVPSADPASRSVTVKALLPTNESLYPGMFGRLLIPTGTTGKIYIPKDAVRSMGQLEFVEVLENGRPARRYIRTGGKNNQGQIEVVSGLQTGEIILLP